MENRKMLGNIKRSKKINKIVISIIFCIIITMPKIVFAATIDLSKDKEMKEIIMALGEWETQQITVSESEYAKKIIEVCGGDIEKIKKLQNTYTFEGITYWHGMDKNSYAYKATNIAIETIQTKTEVETGNTEDEEKLRKEIEKLAQLVYSGKSTTEDEKKLNEKLSEYRKKYGDQDFITEIAIKVDEKLKEKGETDKTAADEIKDRQEEREEYEKESDPTGKLGTFNGSTIHTPDEIITEANEFVSQGTTSPIDGTRVKEASSTLYNLLLSIGIFLAVGIGVYLGVKFMLSTAEDKAKVKEALIPYIVGCIIIFSAFIIWKIIIELLGGIS